MWSTVVSSTVTSSNVMSSHRPPSLPGLAQTSVAGHNALACYIEWLRYWAHPGWLVQCLCWPVICAACIYAWWLNWRILIFSVTYSYHIDCYHCFFVPLNHLSSGLHVHFDNLNMCLKHEQQCFIKFKGVARECLDLIKHVLWVFWTASKMIRYWLFLLSHSIAN